MGILAIYTLLCRTALAMGSVVLHVSSTPCPSAFVIRDESRPTISIIRDSRVYCRCSLARYYLPVRHAHINRNQLAHYALENNCRGCICSSRILVPHNTLPECILCRAPYNPIHQLQQRKETNRSVMESWRFLQTAM